MQINLLSNNEWIGRAFGARGWQPLHGGSVDVVEPATGRTLSRVALANAQDIREAAQAARHAQRGWAAMP
jgi:benzaldehyde dehydrogenase (NAD)